MSTSRDSSAAHFEVRFASLFRPGRALSFPCDREGRVDLDALTERARSSYLSVCGQIGREYSTPQILAAAPPLAGQSFH